MAHTHEYDCVVCGAHFDSQDDLAATEGTPKQAIDIPRGGPIKQRRAGQEPDDRMT